VVKKPAVSLRAAVAGSIGETLAAMREPALFMWAMYLLLVPVYLWASGLPQPGDILIILLAPLALARWNGRLSPPIASVMRALVLFTVYVVIVNVAWSLALNQYAINLKKGFGLSPLFYIYNALVFLIVVVMYQRFGQRLLWFTGKVILYALVLQVGAAFALGGASRARRCCSTTRTSSATTRCSARRCSCCCSGGATSRRSRSRSAASRRRTSR
jgi:hypothetical protein